LQPSQILPTTFVSLIRTDVICFSCKFSVSIPWFFEFPGHFPHDSFSDELGVLAEREGKSTESLYGAQPRWHWFADALS